MTTAATFANKLAGSVRREVSMTSSDSGVTSRMSGRSCNRRVRAACFTSPCQRPTVRPIQPV